MIIFYIQDGSKTKFKFKLRKNKPDRFRLGKYIRSINFSTCAPLPPLDPAGPSHWSPSSWWRAHRSSRPAAPAGSQRSPPPRYLNENAGNENTRKMKKRGKIRNAGNKKRKMEKRRETKKRRKWKKRGKCKKTREMKKKLEKSPNQRRLSLKSSKLFF